MSSNSKVRSEDERVFHVYVGFSEQLNRRSFESKYNQIYVFKFGFCEVYQRETVLNEWKDRFCNGYPLTEEDLKNEFGKSRFKILCRDAYNRKIAIRNGDGTPKRASLPLALVSDWKRIAYREVMGYKRAFNSIETPLKNWAEEEFRKFALYDDILAEITDMHSAEFPINFPVNGNGIGEIYWVDPTEIDGLKQIYQGKKFNDPLADELLDEVFAYIEKKLSVFANSLGVAV